MDTVPPRDPQDNPTPKTTFIYVLIDPETSEVRYVGKSNHPRIRRQQHSVRNEATYKGYWINSLRARGLEPLIEIIEEVPFAIWQERELYWIEYHLQHGHPLTNTYFGSDGVGMVPPEVRAKMSASHLGKPGRPLSPEHKAKLSRARKGKPGHTSLPETNAKISAANTGKKRGPFSEEWRYKLGSVSRGKKQSPEHVANRANAKRGKKVSLEGRANISLGIKRARAMRMLPPDAPTLWD